MALPSPGWTYQERDASRAGVWPSGSAGPWTDGSALLSPTVPPEDTRIDGGPVLLLQAGIPHNLTCRAFNAKPAATITWFRDGAQQEGAVASTVRPRMLPTPSWASSQVIFPSFPPEADSDADREGALKVIWTNRVAV